MLARLQGLIDKGVAIFTVVEILTLTQWLAALLARQAARAAGILVGGLFIEHVIQGLVKANQRLSLANAAALVRQKGLLIAVFTVVEAVIWIASDVIEGVAGAPLLPSGEKAIISAYTFGFLAITLTLKHALAENVFERGRLSFDGAGRGRNVLASIIEAAGGAIWLAAPSAVTVAIMTVTQYIEHYLLTRGK